MIGSLPTTSLAGGAHFHKYLRFSEALAYARSLNLNSVRAWHETAHPPNVPRWPNTAYRNQFISWRHWLGKTALSQVQAAKTFQENRLLVVARLPDSPANQLYVYVEPDGFPGLRSRWRQYQFHLLKVFYYEDGSRWQKVMDAYSEGTDGHTWTVWNVSGALFDIDLEAVPPHELRARLVDQ
jgi:hypothetical protein